MLHDRISNGHLGLGGKQRAAGENPTGAFRVGLMENFYEIQITCLQVTGNRASFGGVVTDSNYVPPGSGLAFTVLDTTPQDLISRFEQITVPAADTPNCGSTAAPILPLTGDIVVEDN